jgi:type IV pilus assembly protein PilA
MSSFCAACGNSMTAEDRFCRVCGRDAAAGSVVPSIGAPLTPGAPAETSGKAIVSLICGLLFFIPLAFVAAIVFGHLGLSEIRKSAGRLQGEGMAIAGLILGYMWIVGIPIVMIIAAIAIPNLLRARISANEASAIGGVRTLITAEVTYAEYHRENGYTCSLTDLRKAQLITSGMESGQKDGYAFELLNCRPETSGGANTKFQIVAHPLFPNQSGKRTFCSDEFLTVKVDSGGSVRGCLERGTSF